MARIRSVHPELFTDEAFCALTTNARLLYIGLWTLCDDHGIFEWKPFGMKINILPVDNVDVGAHLAELERGKQIRQFELDGKAYGAVRNFCFFQRPKKPSFKHPFPDWCRTYVALDRRVSVEVENQLPTAPEKPPHRRGEERSRRGKDNPESNIESFERVAPEANAVPSPSAPGSLSEASKSVLKEGGSKPCGLASAIGTELPPTWIPDDELCEEVKRDYGMADDDIEMELRGFHAKHAAEGTYSANWRASFVTWCKRWKEFRDRKAPARVELSKAQKDQHAAEFKVFVVEDSDEWKAWRAARGGRSMPAIDERDTAGRATGRRGFRFPSQWPPKPVEAPAQAVSA